MSKLAFVVIAFVLGFAAGAVVLVVAHRPSIQPAQVAVANPAPSPCVVDTFDVDLFPRQEFCLPNSPVRGQHLLKLDVVPYTEVGSPAWKKMPVDLYTRERMFYRWLPDSRWRFTLTRKGELVTLDTLNDGLKAWTIDVQPYYLEPGMTFSLETFTGDGPSQLLEEKILLQRQGGHLLYAPVSVKQ